MVGKGHHPLFPKFHAKNFPSFIYGITEGLRGLFCKSRVGPMQWKLNPAPNLPGQVISTPLLLFAPLSLLYIVILGLPQAQAEAAAQCCPSWGYSPMCTGKLRN